MKAATSASFPGIDLPRPAVSLLLTVGPGTSELSLAHAVLRAEKPKSTVARWLSELVDASIILRWRRDEYIVPSRPTLALLLNESSPYWRSVLLHHDALTWLRFPHAFACIPIRRAMPFTLERASPVLNLDDPRVLALDASAFPDAFRASYRGREKRADDQFFPSSASNESQAIARKLPTIEAPLSLALFAASADARVVQASLAAAVKLDIDPRLVTDRASQFVVETPPLKRSYPNTLVLPRWLSRFHDAATASLAQRYLAEDAQPPTTPAGEDE